MQPGIASLGMYDPPWLQEANDDLWSVLAASLEDCGLTNVPATLSRDTALTALWQDPALLLAQTCGYPLQTSLRGKVRYVATPSYAWPSLEPAAHCSLVIVPEDATVASIPELRGQVLALNGPDSNSGMNLLRALVAPYAGGRPFFARVLASGSHLASMAAVKEHRAGVAAIDAVTYALARTYRPELTEGLRVLAVSESTPGLPLITSKATSDTELALLRRALSRLLDDPKAARAAARLGLTGFVVREETDYDLILSLEAKAAALGYPKLV